MKLTNVIIGLVALHDLTANAMPTSTTLEVEDMSYPSNPLEKRACWTGEHAGWSSSKKRCWRRCGSTANYKKGHWCWLALRGDGTGPWATCEGNAQNCRDWCKYAAGQKNSYHCGAGNCNECGCGC